MTTMQGVSPALVQFNPVAATGLALAAAVCLIGPVLAGLWWHRRSGAPLAAFGAGALVFLVLVVLALAVLATGWQLARRAAALPRGDLDDRS